MCVASAAAVADDIAATVIVVDVVVCHCSFVADVQAWYRGIGLQLSIIYPPIYIVVVIVGVTFIPGSTLYSTSPVTAKQSIHRCLYS